MIIMIDDSKYDYDFLVKKYGTNSLRKLVQHVRDYNAAELAKIEVRHAKFDDEIQKQYDLAIACGFNIDSRDLMKGQ
jgi:hypothetical protein